MEIDILATLVENFEKCPPPFDRILDTRLATATNQFQMFNLHNKKKT